eukprot:scaffold315664_cov28-Tisochrysis_lutea.AAC.4
MSRDSLPDRAECPAHWVAIVSDSALVDRDQLVTNSEARRLRRCAIQHARDTNRLRRRHTNGHCAAKDAHP